MKLTYNKISLESQGNSVEYNTVSWLERLSFNQLFYIHSGVIRCCNKTSTTTR